MKRPSAADAAIAVRGLGKIATTWDEYFEQQRDQSGWLNSYSAAKLVQEQCNGIDRKLGRVADGPVSFVEASDAVAKACPSLFAEYWIALHHKEAA